MRYTSHYLDYDLVLPSRGRKGSRCGRFEPRVAKLALLSSFNSKFDALLMQFYGGSPFFY